MASEDDDSTITSTSTSEEEEENDNDVAKDLLAVILKDDALHDVSLKGTDGVIVGACRAVLSAKSPVFRQMLVGSFSESKSRQVALGYKGAVLQAVVEFIHVNEAQLLNAKKRKAEELSFEEMETLISLVMAAVYFDLQDLAVKTEDHITMLVMECPSFGYALLESCRRVGPAVSEDLSNFALTTIRSNATPPAAAVACLSAPVLEDILKDADTVLDEYDLFLLLSKWVEASPTDHERREAAKLLGSNIRLEAINPVHLATIVASSELFREADINTAFKLQALAAHQEHSLSFQKPRVLPVWSSTLSQVYTRHFRARGGGPLGVLKYPTISPGSVHEWTLEMQYTNPSQYLNVYFGVVAVDKLSALYDRTSEGYEATWVYDARGNPWVKGYVPGTSTRVEDDNNRLQHGDQVRLTLNLADGSGTISATVLAERSNKPYFCPMSDLLRSSNGFAPIVRADRGAAGSVRLISIRKLQGE